MRGLTGHEKLTGRWCPPLTGQKAVRVQAAPNRTVAGREGGGGCRWWEKRATPGQRNPHETPLAQKAAKYKPKPAKIAHLQAIAP